MIFKILEIDMKKFTIYKESVPLVKIIPDMILFWRLIIYSSRYVDWELAKNAKSIICLYNIYDMSILPVTPYLR